MIFAPGGGIFLGISPPPGGGGKNPGTPAYCNTVDVRRGAN